MTTYYICSLDIARKHLIGCLYKPVHCKPTQNPITIFSEWLGDDIVSSPPPFWTNAVLLKDLDETTRLMLTLQDPLFREVTKRSMTGFLIKNIILPWNTLA